MIEEITHQAKTRTERIEGQVWRLCATLQPVRIMDRSTLSHDRFDQYVL